MFILLSMDIELKANCNCRCIFCNDYEKGANQFNDLIRDVALCKENEFYICGNEPLNSVDLIPLILFLRKEKPLAKIYIKSSGVYNYLPVCNFIENIDKIELPIYGNDKEMHNYITGNKNAWQKLFDLIDFIVKKGFSHKILFHTVCLACNYKSIKDIYDLIISVIGPQDYFKIIYPQKNNLDSNAYRKIIVPQRSVIKKLIEDFDVNTLKKIELINFDSIKKGKFKAVI